MEIIGCDIAKECMTGGEPIVSGSDAIASIVFKMLEERDRRNDVCEQYLDGRCLSRRRDNELTHSFPHSADRLRSSSRIP